MVAILTVLKNPADWGSNTYYENDYEFNYLGNKLERVRVVGESATDSAGLCINGMCTAYQSLQDVKLELQNAGFWDNLFSPPPIPAPACSPLVPASPRGVTSQDEFQDRQIAAGQIMMFTQGFNQIGSNGKVFVVYYSDGGSELWQFTSGNPARPNPKGGLKQGDGVSKCP